MPPSSADLSAAFKGNPINPDTAETLAHAGKWREALAVWQGILASSPANDQLNRRAILLLSRWFEQTRARRPSALRVLRALAERIPASAKLWAQLAEVFTGNGQILQAIIAWDRVVALGGANIHTQERRDRLWFTSQARGNAKNGPRILVIGNCQALGIALSLRRLNDEATVAGELWATYRQPSAAEQLLSSLDDYDFVFSQFFGKPIHTLRSEELSKRSRNFVCIPRIVFTGYHPDLLRRPDLEGGGRLLIRGAHSLLVAAAYSLGVPKLRVSNLFNAYCYAALGYFDEFEKARRLQLLEGQNAGFDLADLLTQWIQAGPFVHVPDHPTATTLHTLARALCLASGLPANSHAQPPHDVQQERNVWPIYPEIGRRLGIEGSLSFLPHQPPAVDLTHLIDHYYCVYDAMGVPDDHRVREAVSLLRREGI